MFTGFKARSKEDQKLLNEYAEKNYGMKYPCDLYGRFPWHCERRLEEHYKMKTVSLSKSSLGTFCYEVLSRKGDIKGFFVIGSSVFPSVRLTLDDRDAMIKETGYCLTAPPVVGLS